MGIQGLLPQLKSITHTVHVREYAGQRVAIDGYSWLHKGAFTCSKELCEGTPTDKCVGCAAVWLMVMVMSSYEEGQHASADMMPRGISLPTGMCGTAWAVWSCCARMASYLSSCLTARTCR